MRLSSTASLTALAISLLLAPAVPAMAEDTGDAPLVSQDGSATVEASTPSEDTDTIVVLGARLVGQVETAQPALLALDASDIAAYGAGSISELIEQLGPQTTSGRGRGDSFPILLVNGVRISSPRELRSYPPEAIERLEVFPEEVALQYGYSPDQRVVNIVLKRNFSSRELEGKYGQPWEGGYSTQELEATYVRINGPSRLNANLEWNNSSPLTEFDRGIVQTAQPDLATDPDPALYRSLVADSAGLEGTLNWTTRIGLGNSLSLNATYERDDTLRLQGLDSVQLTDPSGDTLLRTFNADDPLTIDTRTQSWSTGATLNVNAGDWELNGTLDATFGRSVSVIARSVDTSALEAAALAGTFDIYDDLPSFADAGVDTARTNTFTSNATVTARTRPVELPAGEVMLTLDAGFRWNGIDSVDTRNPGIETNLDRRRLSSGVNLGVPITSRDEEYGGFIGDLMFNLSAGVDELSDFGTLIDWNSGLTWGVTDTLAFTVTYVNRDTAPTLSQLGNPEVATQNVSVFDLTNNETALVTVISGGNQFLPAQNQSDWKFGVQWQLPLFDDSRLSVDYIRNRSTDVTASFPTLTPAIEAAFPDRVTRDVDGTLLQIDQRPITYARQNQERIQVGLNFSGRIGGSGQQGGAGRGGFGGGFGGPPPGAGGGGAGGAGGPPRGGGGFLMGAIANAANSGSGSGAAAAGQGTQGGPPAGFRPDPARFAQMRATFCQADPEVLRARLNQAITAAANGEAPPVGDDGQPLSIPPQMLQRLAGEDGVIDASELETMRSRICSGDGPPQMAGGPGAPGGAAPDGAAPSGAAPAAAGGGGAATGGAGGVRLPFGPGGRGGNGGRWFVNAQYTLELQDEVLIAPGIPLLDMLGGDGNQARHSANVRVGTFYNGFGMFWDGTYTGNSTLTGTSGNDLTFHDYVKVNVRVFADLGQRASLVEAVPFFTGSRIGFNVSNLFDARQHVTDSTGAVPTRYQPYLVDPVGRSFEIEFRKLF